MGTFVDVLVGVASLDEEGLDADVVGVGHELLRTVGAESDKSGEGHGREAQTEDEVFHLKI